MDGGSLLNPADNQHDPSSMSPPSISIEELLRHVPASVRGLVIDRESFDFRTLPDLPALERLSLIRLRSVVGWDPERMPALRELHFAHLPTRPAPGTWPPSLAPTDLGFLAAAVPGLQGLSLHHLASLSSLDAFSCLEALERLKILCYLDRLSDISALSTLPRLAEFELRCGETIPDLAPLAELPSLRRLRLHAAPALPGLAFLVGMAGLEDLDLVSLKRGEPLEPLAALPRLRRLRIHSFNESIDLSPLHGLARLEEVDLSECRSLERLSGARALDTCRVKLPLFRKPGFRVDS